MGAVEEGGRGDVRNSRYRRVGGVRAEQQLGVRWWLRPGYANFKGAGSVAPAEPGRHSCINAAAGPGQKNRLLRLPGMNYLPNVKWQKSK